MNKAVLGMVGSYPQADNLVGELQRSGFPNDAISVLFPDKHAKREVGYEQHSKAPEGAVAGVGTGGVIGGAIGLLAGLGALAIPGLGPFIAAGPILAAMSGAAAGATVGGITGALIGLGIPEIEARVYEGKIRRGDILVACHVETTEERRRAKQAFERIGAKDIAVMGEDSVPRDSHP